MKKISKLFLFVFIGVGLVSCGNEDLIEGSESTISVKNLEFIYNDITYSSPYTIEKDSILVIQDENVSALYEKLSNLPELATYVNENGVEEYFDNSEVALQQIINTSESNNLSLRVSGVNGTINLFADRNYKGRILGFNFSDGGLAIPDFGVYNYHDVASSLAVWATGGYMQGAAILYEHGNYGGRSIIFTFQPWDNIAHAPFTFRVPNLKEYIIRKPGLFNHSVSWEDFASSLKVKLSDRGGVEQFQ